MVKNKTDNQSERKSENATFKKNAVISVGRQKAKRKRNDGLKEKQIASFKEKTRVRRSPRNHELHQPTGDISNQPMKIQQKRTVKEPVNNNLKQLPKQPMKEPSKQALKNAAKQAMRETTLKVMKHTSKSSAKNQASSKTMKNNNRANQNIKEKTDSLYSSRSKRLDKLVPKVEDILRSIEEANKFKEIQELIDKSSQRFFDNLREKKVDESEKNEQKNVYNCKRLKQETLKRMFKQNVEFLDNIFYGKVYNERHELFKQDSVLNNFTDKDLRVNETTSVFTAEQLIYIVSLFRNRYDKGNIYKYSDYYFKVLLPEFCLKIFMDNHKQFRKRDEAMEYLKSLPVPKIL